MGTISRKPKVIRKRLSSRILRDYTFGNSLQEKKNMIKFEPQWIVGFVDGEGWFHIGVTKNSTLKLGYQILPEFVISKHQRDIKLLYNLKSFFGCGVVKKKNEKVSSYHVRDIDQLANIILPFFEKHQLKTMKKVDFLKFRHVVRLMVEKKHLTQEGLDQIFKIKDKEFKIESSPFRKDEG